MGDSEECLKLPTSVAFFIAKGWSATAFQGACCLSCQPVCIFYSFWLERGQQGVRSAIIRVGLVSQCRNRIRLLVSGMSPSGAQSVLVGVW